MHAVTVITYLTNDAPISHNPRCRDRAAKISIQSLQRSASGRRTPRIGEYRRAQIGKARHNLGDSWPEWDGQTFKPSKRSKLSVSYLLDSQELKNKVPDGAGTYV